MTFAQLTFRESLRGNIPAFICVACGYVDVANAMSCASSGFRCGGWLTDLTSVRRLGAGQQENQRGLIMLT
jgi:hypothetical protein